MAEYTFWAIRESDVTWPGTQDEIGSGPYAYWQVGTLSASLSFAIDDISKFRQVTIRDDDPRLNQWLDSASGQDAQTPVDFPTGGGNSFVATTTTKAVNELDGGRIIRFDDQGGTDGWITFTGIEPGAIKEGEIYTLSRISEDWSGTNPYADSPEYDTLYVTCFTSNTLIETNHGNKPVEDLRPGDMIATMDNGYQPIRWIGSTARDAVDLAHHPKLKPVRIPAGALGGGLPKRDLTVSRQHRVLIRSKIAQRMFGAEEVLIPAIKLVGLAGIEIVEDCADVTYFHILFDKHQVIFSEDAPTESLFTGPVALQSVPAEARKEIETLFPEIIQPDFVAQSARPIPAKGAQIKQLVERHKKRDMPLLNN